MWDAIMAENRMIKLGKRTDFMCHIMEQQLGAYTNCGHGAGLGVLHPVYYRHICEAGRKKFARFASQVWGISSEGKTEEELAHCSARSRSRAAWKLSPPLFGKLACQPPCVSLG